MSHFKTLCSECNTIINQCRCPSRTKTINYEICNKCHGTKEKAAESCNTDTSCKCGGILTLLQADQRQIDQGTILITDEVDIEYTVDKYSKILFNGKLWNIRGWEHDPNSRALGFLVSEIKTPLRHDNIDGPCECGSWHAPESFIDDVQQSDPPALVFTELPFGITFTWKDKSQTITLENGEDIFVFAEIIKDALDAKNILYTENINCAETDTETKSATRGFVGECIECHKQSDGHWDWCPEDTESRENKVWSG